MKFFHKHTSFLLHSFAIYLAETQFGLVEPQHKDVLYGISKFLFVLALSCLLAVPFTATSKRIGEALFSRLMALRRLPQHLNVAVQSDRVQ